MEAVPASHFKHTTAKSLADIGTQAGISILEEEPRVELVAGIYLRGLNGKLWPARTVCGDPVYEKAVINAWMARDNGNFGKGVNENHLAPNRSSDKATEFLRKMLRVDLMELLLQKDTLAQVVSESNGLQRERLMGIESLLDVIADFMYDHAGIPPLTNTSEE
jgi:hypothetical protein